jgi:uncharacterized membrane protein YfcA
VLAFDLWPFVVTLAIVFFVTAVLYSAAGFGGGSTYSAVLLGVRVPAPIVPLISLPCNIVVSGTGFLRALRREIVPVRLLFSILIVSVPAAFLGGIIPLSRELFLTLLAMVLLYAGGASLVTGWRSEFGRQPRAAEVTGVHLTSSGAGEEGRPRIIVAGALIGFVSGLVGIGGGIMLSPILQRERILRPQEVSALSAGFILFNSVAALSGKLIAAGTELHRTTVGLAPLVVPTATLAGIVLIGGLIGSSVALRGLTAGRLRLITGVLLVSVSLRVLV